MGRNVDRGAELLAVWVRSVPGTILIWAVLALTVAVVADRYWATGRLYADALPGLLLSWPALLLYALHPRLRFFEGGVEFPAIYAQKTQFLTWQQVDRYRWDGDMLVLIGTNSVLAGGPSEGGAARIQASRREAVEQILAAKVRSA